MRKPTHSHHLQHKQNEMPTITLTKLIRKWCHNANGSEKLCEVHARNRTQVMGPSSLVRLQDIQTLFVSFVQNLWVGCAKKFARFPPRIERGFGPSRRCKSEERPNRKRTQTTELKKRHANVRLHSGFFRETYGFQKTSMRTLCSNLRPPCSQLRISGSNSRPQHSKMQLILLHYLYCSSTSKAQFACEFDCKPASQQAS